MSSLLQAQSQRLVLLEEFTNAGCGPCASQNPTFNALIDANPTKVISLKYQTSGPGYDVMNVQNPAEVSSRSNYYFNSTGVPYAVIDGDTNKLGASYSGAPANIVQSTINAKYAIVSPFTVVLSHSFSSDYDSIFITMNITNTLAVTGANKARIALVEKHIAFTSAPGSNGEKDFYFVMRKMYPSTSGTAVTATGLGQTQTITIAAPIPAYLYDFNQLAVVAFIQDDVSQNVRQAAFSDAQPLADLIGIQTITGLPTLQCNPDYTPAVTLKNLGSTTLTNCTVDYKFDSNPFTSIPLSCSIAPGLTQTISLPLISSTAGGHDIVIKAGRANNSLYNSSFAFNTISKKAIVVTNFNPVPIAEGFQASTFPGPEWYIDNPDKGVTWTRKSGTGGFGNSTSCAKVDIFSSVNGQYDDLYVPSFDLTNAVSPVNLDFSVAAARKTSTSLNKLEVRLSYDCGATWIVLYTKTGATLATAPINANAFTPTSTQWRAESISLDAYIGQANLTVAFRGTRNGGNNIYVDDVSIYDGTLNVKNISKNEALFSIFQSSANFASIQLDMAQAEQVSYEVYDMLGKKVYTENKGKLSSGNQSFSFPTNSLRSGIYFVQLTVGARVANKKININN